MRVALACDGQTDAGTGSSPVHELDEDGAQAETQEDAEGRVGLTLVDEVEARGEHDAAGNGLGNAGGVAGHVAKEEEGEGAEASAS